jgi:hypothetical protein
MASHPLSRRQAASIRQSPWFSGSIGMSMGYFAPSQLVYGGILRQSGIGRIAQSKVVYRAFLRKGYRPPI